MSDTDNRVSIPAGMRAGKNGGLLRIGGTNKGGPGRPDTKFKSWCIGLLESAKTKRQVLEILEDKSHPMFATMWKLVAERAYGKAPASLDVTTGGERIVVRMDLARTNGNGNGDHAD